MPLNYNALRNFLYKLHFAHIINSYIIFRQMKQRIYLIIAAIFLVIIQGFSQSKKTVTGIVQDNKGKGLVAVSVALLKAKDSSLVKVGVSEKDGSFEINTTATGSFLLSYNALGYEKKYSKSSKGANNLLIMIVASMIGVVIIAVSLVVYLKRRKFASSQINYIKPDLSLSMSSDESSVTSA